MPQQPKSFRHQAEDFIRLLVPDWRPSLGQNLWAIRIVVSVLAILTLTSPHSILHSGSGSISWSSLLC